MACAREAGVITAKLLNLGKSGLEAHFTGEVKVPSAGTQKADLTRHLYFKANMNLISAFAFLGLEGLYNVPVTWMEAALEIVRPQLKEFPPPFEGRMRYLRVDAAR
jgi:hypothetical protein